METLPKDVLLLILSKLDDEDILDVSATNRHFRKICENNLFWKLRAIEKFGTEILNYHYDDKWKERYIKNVMKELYNKFSLFYKYNNLKRDYPLLNHQVEDLKRKTKINKFRCIKSIISCYCKIMFLKNSYIKANWLIVEYESGEKEALECQNCSYLCFCEKCEDSICHKHFIDWKGTCDMTVGLIYNL
jgi:hypothetical protein